MRWVSAHNWWLWKDLNQSGENLEESAQTLFTLKLIKPENFTNNHSLSSEMMTSEKHPLIDKNLPTLSKLYRFRKERRIINEISRHSSSFWKGFCSSIKSQWKPKSEWKRCLNVAMNVLSNIHLLMESGSLS